MTAVKNFWSSRQFHLNHLNLPQAWQELEDLALSPAITYGRPSVVIAVNDQGVETTLNESGEIVANHPDFIAQLTNGQPKFQLFYDFKYHTFSVSKLESGLNREHGMAATSVITSQPNAASFLKGIYEGMVGIAANCQMISGKTDRNSDIDSAQGELLWLAGIDPKKLIDNNSMKAFKDVPIQGADIISLSFQFLYAEPECKATIGLLTSIGRQGRGTLCFLAAGNGGQGIDSFSGDNQLILTSDKLFGIASSMISSGADQHNPGSNYANALNQGVDFCVPDLIVDDLTKPFAASFKGEGRIIGNLNAPFKLKITSINSAGTILTVDDLPTSFNGVAINYSSMSVQVGDKSDLSTNNRYKVLEEDNIISNTVSTNQIVLQTPLIDKANKKSITIHNITNNPALITKLTNDISAGATNIINVYNSLGFAVNQKVTIGQEGRTEVYEATIASGGISGNSITLTGGNIPNAFKKGTVVTVQRVALSAAGMTLTLSDTFALEYAEVLVIGDPTTGNIFRKIGSINHSAKTVTLSGSALPSISYPVIVSGHRAVSNATGSASTKSVKINDTGGLLEDMDALIRLPSDPDFLADNIDSIEASNELKFDNYIVTSPTFPSILVDTPVLIGEGNYNNDFSGTSFSTPVAAGIAGLVLSANPVLNWVEVKYILRVKAQKIDNSNNDSIGRWTTSRAVGALPITPSAIDDDAYSRWYGYGRLDALAAVQEALAYNPQVRDLKIRDITSDDGSPNPTGTSISSPDIWHRVNSFATEGVAAYPGGNANYAANFNLSDADQPIVLTTDTYLYARVNNAGPSGNPTTEKNLDAWVRFYVAVTDQAPSDDLFKFPDFWYGTDKVNQLKSSGTYVEFIDEVKLNEYELDPGSHGSLLDSNIKIVNVKWPVSKKPPANNRLNTYILVLISPFDGGMADPYVHNNNNLTYRKVVFNTIKFNDGSGTKDLQKVIPVDTTGSSETLPFKIELENTDTAFANNIEIKATINYRNGNPAEIVIFKYDGSAWNFVSPPTGGWITLNAPVLSGSVINNIQEFTIFDGSLTVDNTILNISLETKQLNNSAVTVLVDSYTTNVIFNFPEAADGIAEEKKTAIHTFTDFDLLPAQSAIPAFDKYFGPVTGALTTEYRTWSAFSGIVSGTLLKAYAVTNGEFFIQEVPSSNLINLIIKPDNQPDNKIGQVKYFVYRGLKKSSFLTGAGAVLPSSTSGLSDLLTRMWQVRATLNAEAGVTDVIERNDLGLDELSAPTPTPGTTLVEDFFDTYVFQKLSAGWYIGDFDTAADYGFEIIVEGPNYKPTLDDIKAADHKVIITYASGQPEFDAGQEEDIKTKLDREKILSFVDPAAYFGLLAYGKIELKKSSGNITIENDAAQVNTGILTKFGDGLGSKIYIDIRNELNNSLNFYGSYSDTTLPTKTAVLKFKDTTSNFINKQYHTEGWPILILTSADFTAGPSEFIGAEFKLPQGDNTYPGLYLSGSSFYDDGLSYKEKFKILNTASGYTDPFEISIANLSSPSTVLPFIVKLSFTRRYDIDNLPVIPSVLTRPWKDDYLDNLLTINEILVLPSASDPGFLNTVKWNAINELKYIGWTSLKGLDFLSRSGFAKDKLGEVCFTYLVNPVEQTGNTVYNKLQADPALEKNKKNNISFFNSLKENLQLLSFSRLSLNAPNIEIVQLDSKSNNYSIDILEKSADSIASIAYTNANRAVLNPLLAQFLLNSTVYLVCLNHELKNDSDDIGYYEFELGLQGVVYDSGSFQYTVNIIPTGIMCYSVDGRKYFTQDYTNQFLTLNNI
ncbi:MAG TPA: S8 family serine peptidase [Bacteroidia bacterium]|jgi:hypothetical protein